MPFSNGSINRLNLHVLIHTAADNLVNIFLGIYFYQIGFPLWSIFTIWGLNYIVRFIIRPLSVKIQFKVGLKKSIILGTLAYASLYPILNQVNGVNIWLIIFILDMAITDVLYWLPYHTSFAILGDQGTRGKQTGARDSARYLASVLAPITSATLINLVDFEGMFLAASSLMILSILPLIKLKSPPLNEQFNFKKAMQKINKKGFWLYLGDGIFSHHIFAWQLILFILIQDYILFGWLLSLAVLFQVLGSLTIGHLFDKKKKTKLILVTGLSLAGITIIGRSLWAVNIPIIILFDIVYMISVILYAPVINSIYYNACQKSNHPLWFQFFAETGWDIGTSATAFLAALITYHTDDIQLAMALSSIGLLLMFYITKKEIT